jgi:hypothetical protein
MYFQTTYYNTVVAAPPDAPTGTPEAPISASGCANDRMRIVIQKSFQVKRIKKQRKEN